MASIEAFREEGIVENAAAHGSYLADALAALQERHPSVGDVRGLGLFWGLELVKDRDTREPLVPFNTQGEPIQRLTKAALERGLYLFVHWNVVVVCPPLTITREELDEGLGDPRRGARDRGRVLGLAEEALDGSGRLVERVPEHRVPAVHGHDLEPVAGGGAVRVEQVVIRQVRVAAEHEQRGRAHLLERGRRGGSSRCRR